VLSARAGHDREDYYTHNQFGAVPQHWDNALPGGRVCEVGAVVNGVDSVFYIVAGAGRGTTPTQNAGPDRIKMNEVVRPRVNVFACKLQRSSVLTLRLCDCPVSIRTSRRTRIRSSGLARR
jgi:hypothetical protein